MHFTAQNFGLLNEMNAIISKILVQLKSVTRYVAQQFESSSRLVALYRLTHCAINGTCILFCSSSMRGLLTLTRLKQSIDINYHATKFVCCFSGNIPRTIDTYPLVVDVWWFHISWYWSASCCSFRKYCCQHIGFNRQAWKIVRWT